MVYILKIRMCFGAGKHGCFHHYTHLYKKLTHTHTDTRMMIMYVCRARRRANHPSEFSPFFSVRPFVRAK